VADEEYTQWSSGACHLRPSVADEGGSQWLMREAIRGHQARAI
jgi:hypothetical protein